nr:hypothetical protein [Tanacetum cinerariifolium]
MLILALMLNDDIKASAEYLEYLKKAARGSTPIVKGGKGLLSKKGVKIAIEQLRIPKRKRSKTVTEEVYESEQMGDQGKGSGITQEVLDELVHKSLNKGAGVNPAVPDESDSSSRSSSSDSEVAVEDISSDEDEVTKKTDNAKTADAEKDTEVQVADEQVTEKQAEGEILSTDQGGNEPASEAHPDVYMVEALPHNPEATLISSSQTLSSTKFINQFIDEHA